MQTDRVTIFKEQHELTDTIGKLVLPGDQAYYFIVPTQSQQMTAYLICPLQKSLL
jgi:hypothetical protein